MRGSAAQPAAGPAGDPRHRLQGPLLVPDAEVLAVASAHRARAEPMFALTQRRSLFLPEAMWPFPNPLVCHELEVAGEELTVEVRPGNADFGGPASRVAGTGSVIPRRRALLDLDTWLGTIKRRACARS